MNTQPEALRLADFMIDCIDGPLFHVPHYEVREAAAELRRLHEENKTLKQCLKQAQDAAVSLSKANIKALEFIERCPAIYKAPEAAQALRQALAQPDEVLAEREACLKEIAIELDEWGWGNNASIALNNVAANIRARGKK